MRHSPPIDTSEHIKITVERQAHYEEYFRMSYRGTRRMRLNRFMKTGLTAYEKDPNQFRG